jgi:hypothetical protein
MNGLKGAHYLLADYFGHTISTLMIDDALNKFFKLIMGRCDPLGKLRRNKIDEMYFLGVETR